MVLKVLESLKFELGGGAVETLLEKYLAAWWQHINKVELFESF